MKSLLSLLSALWISFSFTFPQGPDSLNIPPLLIANNGTSINTIRQWEEIRRPEIIEMFKENMYGKVPEDGYSLVTKVIEQSKNALNGKAVRKQVELKIYNRAKTDSVVSILLIYLPKRTI